MQEWKNGDTTSLGNIRPYDPKPPPQPAGKRDVDLNDYPLRLVKVEFDMNPSKKGWHRFRISLPVAVRSRYIDDPVYGEDWKALISDFDTR